MDLRPDALSGYKFAVIRIHASIESEAPAETLWSVLTRHEDMPRWAKPVKRVHLDPAGAPDRDGLGAVRHVHAIGPAIVERIVEWQPPQRYVYRLEGGAPIKQHRGEVNVQDLGGRSRATWDIEFKPVIPFTGFVIKAVLKKAVNDMLAGAAKLAEAGG